MRTWPRALALVGLALGAGCGGDGDGDGAAPPPGVSADGWTSAFNAEGAAATCGAGEAAFARLPHVAVGGSKIYAGYAQVSGNNQDPVVARFDGGTQIWCVRHEQQGPDGRAHGVTWNGGGVAYVVYTVVGGGTALEGKGGWLSSYAPNGIRGGGSKVTYVGQIDVTTGALVTGTFVIAVKSDNSVNSHTPRGAVTVLADGGVELLGSSAHKAIDVDGRSAMSCTDYPFESRYRLSLDLRSVACADCTNCASMSPCD